MKKYIAIILLPLMVACELKGEDHSGHDHEEEEKKQDQPKKETHENEIHLTESQLVSAKLKVESLGKKEIRNRIAVTGTIEAPPQNKATIYAPMEAFVHETDLLPGDKVVKGQTVAVLQHPNFVQLQYSYLEATNNRDVAKADYERKKTLYEQDIVSKKSFQAVEASYKSLQSLVSSYASQLKMAGLSPQVIAQKGIQQYVYITSPISGYVVENNLNKGKFLSANSEMMEIIDNDHIHAELNVFGIDISKIKKGEEFVFRPSGIDTLYNGYIKLISQKVDDNTKTVNVHGHFEDPENKLKSGMFINADILLKGREVIAVPEGAIIENEGETFVFIEKQPGEFAPVEVEVGDADKGFVELKSIQNNDFNVKVVTSGAHFLKGKLLQMGGDMEGHAH